MFNVDQEFFKYAIKFQKANGKNVGDQNLIQSRQREVPQAGSIKMEDTAIMSPPACL